MSIQNEYLKMLDLSGKINLIKKANNLCDTGCIIINKILKISKIEIIDLGSNF
jgi:hypothetical protein